MEADIFPLASRPNPVSSRYLRDRRDQSANLGRTLSSYGIGRGEPNARSSRLKPRFTIIFRLQLDVFLFNFGMQYNYI